MQIKLQTVLNILNNLWKATINKAIKISPQKDESHSKKNNEKFYRKTGGSPISCSALIVPSLSFTQKHISPTISFIVYSVDFKLLSRVLCLKFSMGWIITLKNSA